MKSLKKALCTFLALIMVLTAVPLGQFAGLDIANLFATEASAAVVSSSTKIGTFQDYETTIVVILNGNDSYEYVSKVTIDGKTYSITDKDLLDEDKAESYLNGKVIFTEENNIVVSISKFYTKNTEVKITGNKTSITYKDGWFSKKKFSLTGNIFNSLTRADSYNSEIISNYYNANGINQLDNIYITLKSPNKDILYFDKGIFKESEMTFPLGRTIGAGSHDSFDCDIYVNRDYYPPSGSEDVTIECILNGYLNGVEVSGVYSSFVVNITNEDYEEPQPVFRKMSVRELLQEMQSYVSQYERSTKKSTTLSLDISAVLIAYSIGNTANSLDLGETVYEMGCYFSGMKYAGVKEAGKMFFSAIDDRADKKVDEIIGYASSNLQKNPDFDDFIIWCEANIYNQNGHYNKYTGKCPIDIIVTDEDGVTVLKILNNNIEYIDPYVYAFVGDNQKTFYLPTDIEHNIEILATDNGTMDYSVTAFTPSGLERTIEYNDVPLVKDESYTATAPCETMLPADTFNLISESGEEVECDSDSLPPVEDNIVDVIVAEELFDGFPVEIIDLVADTMFNMKSVVDLSAYDISTDDAVALFSAIAKYYPVEYTLITTGDFTYKIIVSPNLDRIMKIRFYYGDDANLSTYQKRVNDLNAEINALVTKVDGMNEFEKALYVHDYIVLNCEYDLEFLEQKRAQGGYLTTEQYQEKYSEYSILVNGTGLCGSYALAYRAVLNAAGMECLFLSSSQMNHGWNLVKIDGNWYHVDCCWDDPVPDTYGRARRTYFLRTDSEIMNLNHYAWSPGQYKATSEKYSDMPRGYDIQQKYDNGKWYYVKGTTLYSSDEYGKNATEITSMSASSIDVDDNRVYFSTGRYIYEYDMETSEKNLVYMLSEKDSGDRKENAYLSNIYIDDENVEFYKSIHKDDKRIIVFDTDSLQREKFASITGFEISQTTAEVDVFETLKLNAEIITTGSTDDFEITWSSSDDSIATVDNTGLITAKNVGTVTITASFFDYNAVCVLNVMGDGLTGTLDSNFKWSFEPDSGKLTLIGEAEVPMISTYKDTTLVNFYNDIKTIGFDDRITSIGKSAFENCESLTSIFIPETISNIGDFAFMGCKNITKITISEGVTKIGKTAFAGCDNILEIKIPCSVTDMDTNAFYAGKKLTKIIVDENNLYYSNDENGALYNKSKTTLIQYPSANNKSFYEIPYGVINIDEFAFYNCNNLTDVKIPDSVVSIGKSAFNNCNNLANISIPENVTAIENGAFASCDSLKFINVSKNNKRYSNDEFGVLFDHRTNSLEQYPIGSDKNFYEITYGISGISDYAFEGNITLKTVKLPDDLYFIGSFAFSNCEGLESIKIPDCVTELGVSAFANCDNLIYVSIGKGLSEIPVGCFASCKSLKSIVIPDNIESIGLLAFSGCEKLTDIVFGHNISFYTYATIFPSTNPSRIIVKNRELKLSKSWCENATIYAYRGSEAQQSAEKYNSNFIAIDAEAHEHDYFLMEYTVGVENVDGYECWECYCGDDSYSITVHNYGEAVNVDPTCVLNGAKKEVCVNCGDEHILETTPAHGEHNYQLVSTTPGDCMTAPIMNYKCTDCDATATKLGTIDDGHKYIEVVVAPTCTEKGYTTATCEVCHETVIYDFTSPVGHDLTIKKSDSYCSAHDAIEYSCKKCDYSEVVAADENNLITETVIVEPTCTKSGTKSEICTLCGATVSTEIISPLSHEYSADFTIDLEATCTTEGRKSQHCVRCDVKRAVTTIDALGHSEEILPAVAATCTATGLTEGKKCSVCGEVTVEQAVTGKLTHKEVTVNQKDATATEDGYTGDVVCERCGDIITAGTVIAATGEESINCNHICHKSGFLGFLWKIARFLYKLFGMNPVCSCGRTHY